ncbi:putative hydrolase or acyltransferase of alpha/beta superfamily [Frankia sp. AiPs1]|uniref:alpha/beta fold hydrolase n=1 Tax=Frankia sp. AiPa1 TaxID=573492 RepID=UPI00202B22E6|nr:alpha/beta hydrolase [Frankia sp. AiPa1]MCL9757775.1 alpha/beta hydrolase [Frankia sp. AiPa1]
MGRSVGAVAGSRAARAMAGSLGVFGAAAVAGLVAERRAIHRRRTRADGVEPIALGPIGGRVTTVIAGDGVPLHVEETGPVDAPLTLLFVHGFCVRADSWVLQQRDLADLGRMVFFDQRAHGRSGPSAAGNCTIDVLADDLYRVIRERVPDGPIVLIGHSMGGMAVLGLAEVHPELFADRIIGVALLSTSASELARAALGPAALLTGVVRRVVPGVSVGMRRTSGILEHLRGRGSDLSWEVTRRIAFGATDLPPAVVTFLENMVSDTPVEVIAAFLPALLDVDRLAAVDRLTATPTVIVVGDVDLMTPVGHSRAIAAALPEAELVVEADAGHAIMLERPAVVNEAIRRLVGRALAEVALPRPRTGAAQFLDAGMTGQVAAGERDAGGSAA